MGTPSLPSPPTTTNSFKVGDQVDDFRRLEWLQRHVHHHGHADRQPRLRIRTRSRGFPTSATAAHAAAIGLVSCRAGHIKFLYRDQVNNGQSVFPLLTTDSFTTVQTTFSPTGPFGLDLDGQKSQDSANPQNLPFNTSEHGLRFFPVIDGSGNVVPNTYLVGLDYKAYATPNSDYQDLFEIVSNVTFQSMPATPIDLHGTSTSAGVNLQWTPVNRRGDRIQRLPFDIGRAARSPC